MDSPQNAPPYYQSGLMIYQWTFITFKERKKKGAIFHSKLRRRGKCVFLVLGQSVKMRWVNSCGSFTPKLFWKCLQLLKSTKKGTETSHKILDKVQSSIIDSSGTKIKVFQRIAKHSDASNSNKSGNMKRREVAQLSPLLFTSTAG